jgi:hypothetical protein
LKLVSPKKKSPPQVVIELDLWELIPDGHELTVKVHDALLRGCVASTHKVLHEVAPRRVECSDEEICGLISCHFSNSSYPTLNLQGRDETRTRHKSEGFEGPLPI